MIRNRGGIDIFLERCRVITLMEGERCTQCSHPAGKVSKGHSCFPLDANQPIVLAKYLISLRIEAAVNRSALGDPT